MPSLGELLLVASPRDAVRAARHAEERGEQHVRELLDGYLRSKVVRYLQGREGDLAELREALLDLLEWSADGQHEAWEARWHLLLELLRDGERHPSLAAELKELALGGRSTELLLELGRRAGPVRPKDLEQPLGLTRSHINNLLLGLEKAGLILRRKGEGVAVWVILTMRGHQLVELLGKVGPGSADRPASSEPLAPEEKFWSQAAVSVHIN